MPPKRKKPSAPMSDGLRWYYKHRTDPVWYERKKAQSMAYYHKNRKTILLKTREANRIKSAAYREVNRETALERTRRWRMNLPGGHAAYVKDYRYKKQAKAAGRPRPKLCELCSKPPGKRALHFDHDHATGAFRGWICTRCNVMIGMANEDIQLLKKAIAYLTSKAPPP